jgi:cephalosporin hydroxylase
MAITEVDLSPDDQWHRHFYENSRHGLVYWRGVQLIKNPMDLWVFAEIIHQVMPRVIIETGTRTGGSSLFYADMMKVGGVPNPKVITVDIAEDEWRPEDDRIVYLKGSSTDVEILDEIHGMVYDRVPRMVFLDSDHSPDHVYAELEQYHHWVTPGSYLVVEDTNFGNPVDIVEPHLHFGGPAVGLERWLRDHPEFEPDPYRERFGVTFNPGAWLRRK